MQLSRQLIMVEEVAPPSPSPAGFDRIRRMEYIAPWSTEDRLPPCNSGGPRPGASGTYRPSMNR
jgi:hypothetical protein